MTNKYQIIECDNCKKEIGKIYYCRWTSYDGFLCLNCDAKQTEFIDYVKESDE